MLKNCQIGKLREGQNSRAGRLPCAAGLLSRVAGRLCGVGGDWPPFSINRLSFGSFSLVSDSLALISYCSTYFRALSLPQEFVICLQTTLMDSISLTSSGLTYHTSSHIADISFGTRSLTRTVSCCTVLTPIYLVWCIHPL